jgi:NADPH2:quinone reductase
MKWKQVPYAIPRSSMKAIVVHAFGSPEAMVLEEKPDLKPTGTEVLVQVKAAGVNPVEAYIRSGMYPVSPKLPYTPGNDAAGLVLAVGPGVHGFKPGDRVYTFGTLSGAYAQQSLVLNTRLQHLPDNITFAQGAALGVPYGTAHRSLFGRAKAKPGETVLVHGASGGVGIAAVQLAKAAGLKVLGTAGNAAGLAAIVAQGAQFAYDHSSKDYLDLVMQETQGKGCDVIIEMAANINLGKDLKALSKNGRVVIVGSRGAVDIDPRDTMGRDATILGMTLANATDQDLYAIHASILEGLRNGTLKPVISEELPLAQAPKAHEHVMKSGKIGKIVLLPEF